MMRSTMIYDRWDFVLVPFPFTDLTANKKRPALVISPKKYNSGPDILVMFVTSRIGRKRSVGDYKIKQWREAGLPKPSMTRMKLATLDKNLIIKKFARLTREDINGLKQQLSKFFDIDSSVL